jgi:hypothetical protein
MASPWFGGLSTVMCQFNQPIPKIKADSSGDVYLLVDRGQMSSLDQTFDQIAEQQRFIPISIDYPVEKLKNCLLYLLEATDKVKQWFFAQNNPTAGFFFISDWRQTSLARHFSQLIHVNSPYGTEACLNISHPEVAWALLKTGCSLFWHPMRKAWLPTRMGWQVLSCPQKVLESDVLQEPLILSHEQWSFLDEVAWRNLLEKVHQKLHQHFPKLCQQHAEDLDIWVDAHAQIARQKGFESERELLLYFQIIGLLGEKAVTTETSYPDIYQLIHFESSMDSDRRVGCAVELALRYSQA